MISEFQREYQEAALRLDLSGEVPVKIPELLAILRERGLQPVLKDGAPVLRGDRKEVSQALLDCVKAHRRELVEWMQRQQEETPIPKGG